MNKNLKTLCLILALAMVLGVAVACKPAVTTTVSTTTTATTAKPTTTEATTTEDPWLNEPVSKPGEFPIVKDPITLTAFAELTSSEAFDWNDNAFLQWIKEKTNVTIKITDYGAEDPITKRNVLLSSGEYPEIFLDWYYSAWSCTDLVKYGQEDGQVLNLTPMIEKYGFYMKQEMEKQPDYFKVTKALDGNIYAFNIVRQEDGNFSNSMVWVNTAWLAKLNMQAPTTTDEYIQMLRDFKTKDPAGVGSANVIPWTGNVIALFGTHFMLAYTECDMITFGFTRTNNGKVEFAANTPEWREGCKAMYAMNKEGLFDPNAFTNNWDQGIAASSSGKVGVYENQHILCLDWQNAETYKDFQLLLPLKGPKGVQNTSTVSEINYAPCFFGAITDACKNPEAAFRVFDLFYSEEATLRKLYGKPGWQWDYNDDPKMLDFNGNMRLIKNLERPADSTITDAEWNNCGLAPGPFNNNTDLYMKTGDGTNFNNCLTDNTIPGIQMTRWAYEGIKLKPWRYKPLPHQMFMPVAESEEYQTIKPNVTTNCAQKWYVEFCTGVKDPNDDATWQAYLDELNTYGVEKYVAYLDEAYQRIK
jgi:putative aldouronate transport system substrate-binding protein